jgi:hypothetical protein
VVDFVVVVVVLVLVLVLEVVPDLLVELPEPCGPRPPLPPGSSANRQTVGWLTLMVTDADDRSTVPTECSEKPVRKQLI